MLVKFTPGIQDGILFNPLFFPDEPTSKSMGDFSERSPGINFINVLQAAFASADPKSAKRQSNCQSFCAFVICSCKICLLNVGEIDYRYRSPDP